ncbi:ATP-binding protein [Burkholderia sp. L27(2015)]|uniref:ATP-binding protein n=1 Tax=Burkholderia sp. L27(2015) TaxID=1641858 RepID=UPI0015769A25|nr:ATP-binding protein [Burkholderia sp. L27(2015)]
MPASIRRHLMLLVFASIALVWGIALLSSFRHATHEVEEWEDARLAEFAQTLTLLDQNDLTVLSKTQIDARDEYSRVGSSGADDDDDKLPRDMLFQVRDAHGRILASSPDLMPLGAWDPPSELPPQSQGGAHTITLGRRVAGEPIGQPWHTYTLYDGASGRTVRVLEPANTRSDLATGAARRISEPIAFALPILALLVWVSIGHSFRPLRLLSKVINAREINQLEPIDMGRSPSEVRPLIDAINHLLSRLRQSIVRERTFTADAAHELKTPLAAIKVQAQVALAAQDTQQQRLAMERVVQGVDRSARLAEQLLLLARLDEHDRMPSSVLALDGLARDVIAANEEGAKRRGIGVALVSDARVEIVAEPVLVNILLDNLIDNALKYCDSGDRVEVEIGRNNVHAAHAAQTVLLTVRDNGPGVGIEEQGRLTDRFFRGTGTSSTGSGLGLSIVARIVEYFGASLSFGAGIDGRGLAVEIAFPCAASD